VSFVDLLCKFSSRQLKRPDPFAKRSLTIDTPGNQNLNSFSCALRFIVYILVRRLNIASLFVRSLACLVCLSLCQFSTVLRFFASRQTFKDFELILVDDGSSDGSWELLQAFTDKRIRTFRFEQNRGVGFARNFAIEEADCDYLSFLDADDVAHPARLAVQVAYLDCRPAIGAAASRAWITDADGQHKQVFEPLTPDEISVTLIFRNPLVTSSVSMRRHLLIPFRADSEPGGDYYLWARLSPVVHFALLKRTLVTYRGHAGGISKRLAARMLPSVRQTHQFQLERLGVTLNLDLHAMLSAWPAGVSSEQLSEAEDWLRDLVGANRIYDPASFQRVAEHIWFQICLDSWTQGPKAFDHYRRSPLAKLTPIRMAIFLSPIWPQGLSQ
jgi:Glycosyl transferase family 2